jgi:hypothetical protein
MAEELITDAEEIKRKVDLFIQSGKLQEILDTKERLAVIKLSHYGKGLVMPYEQAIEFIKILHQAEEVEIDYKNKIVFTDDSGLLDVTFKVVDIIKFNRAKISHALGIDSTALNNYLHDEEIPF